MKNSRAFKKAAELITEAGIFPSLPACFTLRYLLPNTEYHLLQELKFYFKPDNINYHQRWFGDDDFDKKSHKQKLDAHNHRILALLLMSEIEKDNEAIELKNRYK